MDTVISEVILRQAYARLGYRVQITKYPAERALKLADAGRADGDVQRIDGLAKHYPNLIQLRPPTNHIEGSAFTAGKSLTVDGWDSLRPYRIGLIRGIKFAELNTVGMDRHFVGDYGAHRTSSLPPGGVTTPRNSQLLLVADALPGNKHDARCTPSNCRF